MKQPVNFQNLDYQHGQTLIETLVAAMVLVMGIAASVGLAVYGLGATTGITKQIQAVGLAREGIEAVKNIRDTNWLATDMSTTCPDFYTNAGINGVGTGIGNCYIFWLKGLVADSYSLSFDTAGLDEKDPTNINSYWKLVPASVGTKYGLDYDNSNPQIGLFRPTTSGTSRGNSGFSRKIVLSYDNGFPPFNQNGTLGPRVKVHVDVWWEDKNCPFSADVPVGPTSCKIALETYLTNWKNYK